MSGEKIDPWFITGIADKYSTFGFSFTGFQYAGYLAAFVLVCGTGLYFYNHMDSITCLTQFIIVENQFQTSLIILLVEHIIIFMIIFDLKFNWSKVLLVP